MLKKSTKTVDLIDFNTHQHMNVKLGKRKIAFSDRDRDSIMHLFHNCFLQCGYVSISQDEICKIFKNINKVAPALDSLVKDNFINVNKNDKSNYAYSLSRTGVAYFADKQKAARERRQGKMWELLQLIFAAALGAMASRWF